MRSPRLMPSRVARLVLALALVSVAGCRIDDFGARLAAFCNADDDCRAPYICDFGRCRAECEMDQDCEHGACIASMAEPGASVCTVPDEIDCQTGGCPPGLDCAADGLCRMGCKDEGDCPGKKICFEGACFDEMPDLPDGGLGGADAGADGAAGDAGDAGDGAVPDGGDGMCGNGEMEEGETCDPPGTCPTEAECDYADACLVPMFEGDPDKCTANCEAHEITECTGVDGCCPSGCTAANDGDCSMACGDGVVDPTENETCEPGSADDCPASCDDGNDCTEDTKTGSAANCNVRCTNDPTGPGVDVTGSGSCDCLSGWSGATCDQCVNGYHGASCDACPSCGAHGSCNDGLLGDGTCACDTGWAGTLCDACADDYYGASCTACPNCGSHGSCNEGLGGDGQCACDTGWTGTLCDACANGYYGASCTACPNCGSHGSCNEGLGGNGQCACDTGWKGAACATCANGYYGASCTACPNCGSHGSCNEGLGGNGQCACDMGWTGTLCDACADDYVGPTCDMCVDCGANGSCDDGLFGSGACVCSGGYTGMLCDTAPSGDSWQSGLVAWWKLDEASGTRFDSIGDSDLTDVNSVTSATGKVSQAASFVSASNDYLEHADSPELSTGDIDFTIAAWVNMSALKANPIVTKSSGAGNREYDLAYSSTLVFQVKGAPGTNVGSVYSSTSPTTGTWYLVIAWHDSVANTVNIQVNNGAVDSQPTTGAPTDTSSTFEIGRDPANDNPGEKFDGLIDEVGFWKRKLTAGERTALYNGGSGVTPMSDDSRLWVTRYIPQSLTMHRADAQGDLAPVGTLAFGGVLWGVDYDSAREEVFVANTGSASIVVHAPSARGSDAPLRTISGGATGLAPGTPPRGLAVDSVHGEVFVVVENDNAIAAWPVTADGNVAPTRKIKGASTGLSVPYMQLAADPVHDEIAAANNYGSDGAVLVFSRTADGNVAPLRTIQGALTGITNLIGGITIDPSRDEIFVRNGTRVLVFSRTANGNVAPLRTIEGAATTLVGSAGIEVTSDGELLLVDDSSVKVFSELDSGNVAPLRTIAGASTQLSDTVDVTVVRVSALPATIASGQSSPWRMAQDSQNVYWTNKATPGPNGSVMQFAKSGGSPLPLATGQSEPWGIASDGTNVFWGEQATGNTYRVDVDGGGQAMLRSGPPPGNYGFAIDSTYVYWSDDGGFRRTPKASGAITPLYSPGGGGFNLGVDGTSAYSYVSGGLQKFPADGGAATPLISDGSYSCYDLTVSGGNVFWAEASATSAINRIHNTGGTLTEIALGSDIAPQGLAVDSTYVYWTEWLTGKVKKAPIYGGATTLLASGQANPAGIVVDDTHVYWTNQGAGTVMKLAKPTQAYNSLTDASKWSTFDTTTVDANAKGFFGAAFDGRYLYLVPTYNGVGVGTVTRYDTQAAFDSTGSWSTFDTTTVNAGAKGFAGAAFDGRYVYLVPIYNGTSFHGVAARYDTQAAFGSTGSWSTFDVSTVDASAKGFQGAVFDGRYLYLVPNYNGSVFSGIVARYDTQAAFASAGSWSTFDVKTVNAGAKGGFSGAIFDGRYIYLVPTEDPNSVFHGVVARYDTQATFTSTGSWSTFDVSTVNASAKGFIGAAFDGRHLYLAPYATGPSAEAGTVARYDTQATFTSTGSWSTFDVSTVNAGAKGFEGAIFDGRHIYLVPYNNGGGIDGIVARYDTQAAFASNGSWSTFDASTANAGAKGFSGAAFDGRHVYLVPRNDGAGPGRLVTRFDAKSPRSLPTRWNASFF